MVFMGLEKPIGYEKQLIFDPTTAKMLLDAQDMYVNAVYNDYLIGLEEMKEFKKEYGDFMTPILADLDWYNKNVTGKVRDFIKNAYDNGIDLTRSAEGRAAVSQLINSINVGDIAKLRSSAENAKEFLKARKQLEAQGLYNPLLAKYDSPDMSTYSTLDDGVWDKMSPTRITDMATFGNPYFEGMKPNIHKVSKNGVEYSIESITAEDLNRIANDHFNELVSTPQGQLMYKYYRDLAGGDSNPNADIEARRNFNAAVASGLSRRIYQSDNYDDQWAKREQLRQGWAKINQDSEKLNWQKFTDSLLLGLLGDDTMSKDLSYTTQMEVNSIQKYNKLAGIDSPVDYAKTTHDIAQYWKDQADKHTDKDKKDHATKLYNLWENISKGGLEKAEKYGVLVKDKKTGELVPSKMYTRGIGYAYGAQSTGKTSVTLARQLADAYYNRFLSTVGGTEYDKTSADILAGGAGEQKSFPGGAATNKYRVVSLDDRDIYFTPVRRMQVAGYNIQDPNGAKLVNQFNKWLHSSPRIGYMVNSSTSRASIPTINGGRTREISGYARIPMEDFKNGFLSLYISKNGIKGDDDIQKVIDDLGLPMFKMHSREPLKGKYTWKEAEVVEIPITRVKINNRSLEDASLNTQYDENVGGKAAAEKKLISRLKESLNKR